MVVVVVVVFPTDPRSFQTQAHTPGQTTHTPGQTTHTHTSSHTPPHTHSASERGRERGVYRGGGGAVLPEPVVDERHVLRSARPALAEVVGAGGPVQDDAWWSDG